uniref:Uncharacterized protein n=1 Tax=Arundo donax TaxID=35708 RepID=A0A0A8ZYY8_ARUDO
MLPGNPEEAAPSLGATAGSAGTGDEASVAAEEVAWLPPSHCGPRRSHTGRRPCRPSLEGPSAAEPLGEPGGDSERRRRRLEPPAS